MIQVKKKLDLLLKIQTSWTCANLDLKGLLLKIYKKKS